VFLMHASYLASFLAMLLLLITSCEVMMTSSAPGPGGAMCALYMRTLLPSFALIATAIQIVRRIVNVPHLLFNLFPRSQLTCNDCVWLCFAGRLLEPGWQQAHQASQHRGAAPGTGADS
jgi:hypothetical protein